MSFGFLFDDENELMTFKSLIIDDVELLGVMSGVVARLNASG
jgi:hypothetical protein